MRDDKKDRRAASRAQPAAGGPAPSRQGAAGAGLAVGSGLIAAPSGAPLPAGVPAFKAAPRPEITSPRNALVRLARDLGESRREREIQGLSVLEGVRLAEEAWEAGLKVEWFFYTEELLAKERGYRAAALLAARGGRGFLVTAAAMARAAPTETPQGLLAAFRPPDWTLDDFAAGLVLVADGLQDPGNLGTLVRAAEAMGATGVCQVDGVDPWGPKVVRGAMGSLFRLPVVRGKGTAEVLERLQRRGFRILVAEQEGGVPPWQLDLTGAVALVVGNEGAGPSESARRLAAARVSVPMAGHTESLNAAVAASLLAYEALRQRAQAGG